MIDVIVVGAGFVGILVALHLAQRGRNVTLIDKAAPGHGTFFGNAGVVQHEAVVPYAFPRSAMKLASVIAGRGADMNYHWSALPATGPHLLRD